MHVAVDVTSLIYDRGVSRYTHNLIHALLRYTNLDISVYGVSFRRYQKLVAQVDDLERTRSFRQRDLRHLPIEMVEKLWQMGFSPIKKHIQSIGNIF